MASFEIEDGWFSSAFISKAIVEGEVEGKSPNRDHNSEGKSATTIPTTSTAEAAAATTTTTSKTGRKKHWKMKYTRSLLIDPIRTPSS